MKQFFSLLVAGLIGGAATVGGLKYYEEKLSPEEFEDKYVKDGENIDETERKEKQEDGTSDMF